MGPACTLSLGPSVSEWGRLLQGEERAACGCHEVAPEVVEEPFVHTFPL